MPNVVRFALSSARELIVPGAGTFHSGILDVPEEDTHRVSRARYLVKPYGAIELGVTDETTPFPTLPATGPGEEPEDPYPQYLTDAELSDKATTAYVDAEIVNAKNRTFHTSTQAAGTISDLTETVQDIVAAFISPGTGLTKTYDDVANLLTLTTTGGAGTTDPEVVRDTIGSALVQGAGITITLNDAGDTITIASSAVLPTRSIASGTGLTGGGDLSNDRTLAVIYGSTAATAVQGNDARVTADQVAGTASIRTLGTGAQQAKAGNWAPAIADLPAQSVLFVNQNDPAGTWPNRPTSRTDIKVIWTKTVVGSADPTAATSPAVTGAYQGDAVVGV